MNQEIQLIDELDPRVPRGAPWPVLVVDDDPEVFSVTRLALADFEYAGRSARIISASSAAEAREVLQREPGIALVLLDVVMETEHAGLDLVHYIREELRNSSTRIVLRTGQPGQAPPREVVARYEIDDYRTKTELTYERLHTLVLTSLRTFQLLQRMEQKQAQLTRSNRELENFAYVASHDLQTPLRGIIGFAQLLQRGYRDSLDERGRELLDFIVAGAHAMRAVINDVLEYARIGNPRSGLADVDLNRTLATACRQLQAVIEERGALVTGAGLPTIRANAAQMEQLFRNLIDNGIKYQPGAQPQVSIGARELGQGVWELSFADRGIGVAPEHAEYIFELFRRLHTTDQYPGTGIGLAICRKIVQVHGGTIRVESEPGTGASFIVTLPAAPPDPS